MKTTTKKLLKMFEDEKMRPAKISNCMNGKTRFIWHVDDDDDRYVELVDSRRGSDVVVLMRDGPQVAVMMRDQKTVIGQVREYLQGLWVKRVVSTIKGAPLSPEGSD